MPELIDTQRAFAMSLRDAGASLDDVASRLAGGDALVGRRLAIYRANAAASAAKALAAAYPVIAQVVGVEFFGGLARAHQRANPSTSGDLFDYGAGFGDFLAGFAHTQSMPYLPDLARLEWLVHRADGAADTTPWDRAGLAAIPPERQDAIRFAWAPGTAVIVSAYPLARIWSIHQSDHDGDFAVDWSVAERVLVRRDGFRVDVGALPAGEAVFIARALGGATLGCAASAALEADEGFDLGAVLARALASNLICGLAVDEEQ